MQEESNEAAKRFDKANSQHAASKEMIRMAESQLAGRATEGVEPGSPSPLDLAWQEMLNHATNKVLRVIAGWIAPLLLCALMCVLSVSLNS